jgi:hypothetical protein
MVHYVYRLEEKETGEFYIGSRTCKVDPTLDKYLGSMITWKPNKLNLVKTIIKSGFITRDECNEYERKLIIENVDNSLNRNYSIPGGKFHTQDRGQYVDNKGKVYRLHSDDNLIEELNLKPFWEGRKHSEESKRKMSEKAKERWKIEDMTERNKKISESCKGVKKSETHCQHISESKKGENNPMFGKHGKDNPRSKNVYQYDINGTFIKQWDSAKVASEELGLSYKSINHNCRGKTKTSCGFIWSYEKK